MANLGEIKEEKELEALNDFRGLVVLHFWAEWSEPCKDMQEAMEDLAKEHSKVKFYKVAAEDVPELSLKFEVVAVPTFILVKGGKIVDRVNGAHAPELARKTSAHSQIPVIAPRPPAPKEDLDVRLGKLVKSSPCVLFMKGTPAEPKCGFSRQTVAILQEINAEYSTFNILMDDEVRQGLKKFSNWPTYPQLYVNGEFIGGLDIIKEMKENGELESTLPKVKSLDERLKSLINQQKVMLFMKGNPQKPQCGFSRTTCSILQEHKVEFGTFDILSDDEVRQGLKKFSNWPTYPQLYVKGELIGGLDIIKEMKDCGELADLFKD